MLPSYVALVADPDVVPPSELAVVAAALNVQVTRDLGPLWGITASVTPFSSLADVPVGMWQIIIKSDAGPAGVGYHLDKDHNQPYAIVDYQENFGWSHTASHECCEMLIDPGGNRMVPGTSPDGKRRVLYFLEVCDPCQDSACAYPINGVTVSDFITPAFYQPLRTKSLLVDFVGKMTRPHQVLPNGYLCYTDPLTHENLHAGRDGTKPLRTNILGPFRRGASNREESHRLARKFKFVPSGIYKEAYHASGKNEKHFNNLRVETIKASAALAKRLDASISHLR
jgi:hypothetical protein